MRILLDESLPRKLASELTGHETQTVQKRGASPALPKCRMICRSSGRLRYLDFDVAPGGCGIDCADHRNDRSLYPRPAGRRQNNNRKTSVSEVLLVSKVRVGGNHERKPFALGRIEQLAVA